MIVDKQMRSKGHLNVFIFIFIFFVCVSVEKMVGSGKKVLTVGILIWYGKRSLRYGLVCVCVLVLSPLSLVLTDFSR